MSADFAQSSFAIAPGFAVSLSAGATWGRRTSLRHDSSLVQEDWAAQERRLGRSPDGPAGHRRRLSAGPGPARRSASMERPPDLDERTARLRIPRGRQYAEVDQLDEAGRLALYHQIRSVDRGMALKNPLLAGKPIAFMKRRRFICQMLHEYLGYFYDYGDIAGGGVYVLEQPGPVARRPRPDRRPPAEGQLHDAGPVLRCPDDLLRLCRAGRGQAGLSTRRSGGAFTSTPWTPMGRTCGSSPTAATTTSIPVRCPTAASRSCPRGAAGSAAATTPGSRCPPTRCTAWTPTARTSGRSPSTRPTNGIRRC